MITKNKILLFIKQTTVYFFSVIFCFVVLVSLLIFTHSGNKLLLVALKTIEPRFSIELEEGSFLNSPSYSKIIWNDPQAMIQIDSINYDFDWSCLFTKVCLKKLTVSNAQINIAGNSNAVVEAEPDSNVDSTFSLPIEVVLNEVNLKKIHFRLDELAIDLNELHLHAAAKQKDITLTTLIDGLRVNLPKSEPTENSKPASQKAITLIPALLSEQDLPEIILPLNLHVSPLELRNFALKQGNESLVVVNSLKTKFSFLHSKLALHSFILDSPETDLKLDGDIDFRDNYPLNLQLSGQLKTIKQLQPATLLAGQVYSFTGSGDLSKLKTQLTFFNKITMQLSAEINFFKANLPHLLTLKWQNLRWPLTGKAQYSSVAGILQSTGDLSNYHINIDSDYNIENIPTGNLSLQANGGLQRANIEQLVVKTLDGAFTLKGLLNWQKALQWQGQLAIDKVDLAKLETKYTGNFSGLIKQTVTLPLAADSETAWQFTIPTMRIDGAFLKRPFSVNGFVSGDNKKGISFKNVLVNNAENKFVINGLLAEQNDLDIKLNITDLSHALVDATGRITGGVSLQGPSQALQVAANIHGESLTYQKNSLDMFNLNSHFLVSDTPEVMLQLTAQALTVADQLIDSINFDIKNINSSETAVQHQVDLAVQSDLIASNLQFKFIQEGKKLSSLLNSGDITVAEQQLTLNKPVNIVVEEQQVALSPHCWISSTKRNQNAGQLCLDKVLVGESGEVNLHLASYLLANIEPFLPKELKISGALSAVAQIKWLPTEKPVFDVNFFSDDMRLKVKLDRSVAQPVIYPLESFNIKLSSNPNASKISATIHAKNLINAQIQGQLFPYKATPEIKAEVNMDVTDFSAFALLLPDFEKWTGNLQSKLFIDGALHKPVVNGQIVINDTAISITDVPMQIERLNAAIFIKNNSATIDGEFDTGQSNSKTEQGKVRKTFITDAITALDSSIKTVGKTFTKDSKKREPEVVDEERPGRANIKGNIDWRDKLHGDVHFYANKITINDYDKIYFLVSPDLHFQIADELKLNGKILVNRGKVTVTELPEGAVSTSKDIIVVDIDSEKTSASLPIKIALQVDLGRQLQVEALGLNTQVEGSLLITKKLLKDLNIHGELNLIDGSYRALAQQLLLQKSRITFQGPPDLPYLSIEAIRDPSKIEDNVTAGVRVTGTPDALSLSIFSEPSMSQQDTLSYITRGKSLQNSNEKGGSSQLTSMLISLGAGQSSGVMNDIGNVVGIRDLSLSASGSGKEQSVGVSGYIAPGVELSYGVGVFDSFSILAIRYEMFERFYIEASSSIEQAIDAYYEFDWD